MEGKPFWQSKTLWGLLLMVLGFVLPMLGVTVPENMQEDVLADVMGMMPAISKVVGGVLVIIGRFKATKKLTLT